MTEPNFRYTGARLCCIVQESCPFIKAHLHLLCEKELQGTREIQGFTMFVAELYTQLHYDNLYGKSLISALRNLLAEGGSNNIKCLCQALKVRK